VIDVRAHVRALGARKISSDVSEAKASFRSKLPVPRARAALGRGAQFLLRGEAVEIEARSATLVRSVGRADGRMDR